jgi:hypothetical protein
MRDQRVILRGTKGGLAVVTGVREPHIHGLFKGQRELISFEVYCPAEIRFHRLYLLSKCQTAHDFLYQEIEEMRLGVLELEFDAPWRVPTSNQTDPDAIVKSIIHAMQEKKVPLK